MEQATNGHASVAGAQASAQAQVDGLVREIMKVMMQGLIVSMQGVPPEIILRSICRQMGTLAGGALQGDLGPVLALRKQLKESFDKGVQEAPLMSARMPPTPPQPQA